MDAKIASAAGANEANEAKDAAADTKPVTQISVSISDDGTITMSNDGNGIDVIEHPEHKLWIPEMIFAHLRTSTNYNKQEKKIVGGKNGFGVKLVFVGQDRNSRPHSRIKIRPRILRQFECYK
jgi:hypothetical protein